MSMQAGIGAAPKQSDLANIRDQLQNLIAIAEITNGNIGGFFERVNGPIPQAGLDSSNKIAAVPNGLITDIQGLLSTLQGKLSASREMTGALSGIA